MTGTRTDADPSRNGSKPIWYAGKYNLDAVLAELTTTHGMSGFNEVVLSGCSAGGMACYIHCEAVSTFFASFSPPVPVKCICDAGVFLDVSTVTGQGNVMERRFFDVADRMQSKPGLPTACVAEAESNRKRNQAKSVKISEVGHATGGAVAPLITGDSILADWRQCIFSEVAMRYTTTPLFGINSQVRWMCEFYVFMHSRILYSISF
jgi:hypothetical protein